MAFAVIMPVMSPPISPGPAVAATAFSSVQSMAASRMARRSTSGSQRKWARAASSGTTPPNAACSATCESTTSERIAALPSGARRTTAAAVSSQELSIPKTINVFSLASDMGPLLSLLPAKRETQR